MTLTTNNAKENSLCKYTLSGNVEGLEHLESGSYTVFFYFSNTQKIPDFDNSERLKANKSSLGFDYDKGDLSMGDTYYYRIGVATFSGEIYYGPVRSFTVSDKLTKSESVDMGFGITIARCNLGASSPEKYGDRYAYGEVVARTSFKLDNYDYYNSSTGAYMGLGSSIAGSKYDAVTKQQGSEWRIISTDDFVKLKNYCEWNYISYKGVKGYLISSQFNGNSVFLPMIKDAYETKETIYWTSDSYSSDDSKAYALVHDYTNYNISFLIGCRSRYMGGYLRAVKDNEDTGVKSVDLGLPSGTIWADRNLGGMLEIEFGTRYKWGETEEYDSSRPYKYGSEKAITKYCTNDKYWAGEGDCDFKTELEDIDDAATVNWGKDWQIPSIEQAEELIANCYWVGSTTFNGFYVFKRLPEDTTEKISQNCFVSSCPEKYNPFKSTRIFLSLPGNYSGGVGHQGLYYTRELSKDTYNPIILMFQHDGASCFHAKSCYTTYGSWAARDKNLVIRPVRKK